MSLTDTAIERAFAAQGAALTALREAAALADLPVRLGPPFGTEPEAVWVSCSLDGELTPEASDLSQFADALELAIAVAVTQYIGEDWTPLRDRLGALAGASERVVAADPTLGGTCSLALLSSVSVREAPVDDAQVRLTAVLIVKATQYLR